MKIRRRCKCECGKITKPGNKYIHGHNRRNRKRVSGKTKVRRRCKCGCGRITNLGRKWILGHHLFGKIPWNKNKRRSKKTKKKISLSLIGNTNAKGNKGRVRSEDFKLKVSISCIKYDPDYPYCDMWKSREYRDDLRKDYCENINCKKSCEFFDNHHIDLDKKNCHPSNIMTLCHSCHTSLHNKLSCRKNKSPTATPKDYLVINRKDHITYINKKTRKRIIIKRIN